MKHQTSYKKSILKDFLKMNTNFGVLITFFISVNGTFEEGV